MYQNRHVWIRGENMSKVLRVRHAAIKAFRDHYYDRDYVEVSQLITEDVPQKITHFVGLR